MRRVAVAVGQAYEVAHSSRGCNLYVVIDVERLSPHLGVSFTRVTMVSVVPFYHHETPGKELVLMCTDADMRDMRRLGYRRLG